MAARSSLRTDYALDIKLNVVKASELDHKKYRKEIFFIQLRNGRMLETTLTSKSDIGSYFALKRSSYMPVAEFREVTSEENRVHFNSAVTKHMILEMLKSGAIDSIKLPIVKINAGINGEMKVMPEYRKVLNNGKQKYTVEKYEGSYADFVIEDNDTVVIITVGEKDKTVEYCKKHKINYIIFDQYAFDPKGDYFSVEDEVKLKNEIENGTNLVYWGYNVEKANVEEWQKGLVTQTAIRTKHNKDADGEWFIWAADEKSKIVHCPYRDSFNNISNIGTERYLTQKQCEQCNRFVTSKLPVYSLAKNGSMICNHSNISNGYIMGLMVRVLSNNPYIKI